MFVQWNWTIWLINNSVLNQIITNNVLLLDNNNITWFTLVIFNSLAWLNFSFLILYLCIARRWKDKIWNFKVRTNIGKTQAAEYDRFSDLIMTGCLNYWSHKDVNCVNITSNRNLIVITVFSTWKMFLISNFIRLNVSP